MPLVASTNLPTEATALNQINIPLLILIVLLVFFFIAAITVGYNQLENISVSQTSTSYSILFWENETLTSSVGSKFSTPIKFLEATSSSVPPCYVPDNWKSISIQPGDTIEKISTNYNVSVDEILKNNCLIDTKLVSGSVIYLPVVSTQKSCVPGADGWTRTYTVQITDTLYSIAQKYYIGITQLKLVNCLVSDIIYVSMKLWVPNIQPLLSPTFTLTPFQPSTPTP